jgi:CBS-domain-containing membrane protein
MSNIVYSCQTSDTIEKAEQIMRMNMVKRLPVVDADGKLVGILSLSDIAQEAEREVIASNHEISAQEVTATMASISHSKNRRILS